MTVPHDMYIDGEWVEASDGQRMDVVDPATETLADVAAKFDALPNLSAAVADGALYLSADAGYTLDFRPAVLPDPSTSTLTGTASPTLSGVYGGAATQSLTATVVGGGEVGVSGNLAVEVRDAGGTLLGSLNVGAGYAAGDPLAFAHGIEVVFGHGTLVAGEQFTVEAIARSDPTGLLAAAGVNALFSGTRAANMEVSGHIRASSSHLAVALGADGMDNRNARRMAGVADETLAGLGGARPADAFRNVVSEVAHWVSFRQARRDGLQNLVEELQRQRDETSGVDINEEAANILVLEQMFQAMARFLGVVNQCEKDLMNLL